MNNLIISRFQNGQEFIIHDLVKKVYDEFVSPDYTNEGNAFFYDWIEPKKIAERQLIESVMFIAVCESKTIGMIEIRDYNRISLLFVHKDFQKQGIAKKLFETALENCIKTHGKPHKLYVHASPYSIPVYKKLGFVETDKMQEKQGITFMPMEMTIDQIL